MTKQFCSCDLYQYELTTVGTRDLQPKMANMADLSSASSSHIMIRGTAAKIQLPVRKMLLLSTQTLKCYSEMDLKGTDNNGTELLTNRNDPWAESKDLKGLLLINQFPSP